MRRLTGLKNALATLLGSRRNNKYPEKAEYLRTDELLSQTATLERQLEQQRLMASLSQIFVADGDKNEQITESLRLTGEFLNVCRILLMKYEDQSLHYLHEWRHPARNIKSKLGMSLPIDDSEMRLVVAYSQRVMSYFSLGDTDRENFIRRYRLDDIENFLMLPIYIGDDFWGVLEFDQCRGYSPWTPSDINLGETIAGILSGVMTRRQMEEELLQLSSIVENSPQVITAVNSGGSFAYYNPAAVEISGYSREELDSGGLHILLESEDYRQLKEDIVPIILRNKKHTYKLPFITKSGETRIMSLSAFILNSNENIICSIASDITDMVMMQRELERHSSELALQTATISSVFASIPDVVFCKDLDLMYTRCNKSFELFFNCREEDVLGRNEEMSFGIPAEIINELRESEKKVIREMTDVLTEELIPSATGEARLFETIRTPLIRDGKPIGLMGIARDITERKVAEDTLKLTLNNLDACVYITEIETGKILFINKRMAEEYNDEDCVGKRCWEILQKGYTERCDFCPVPKLLESGDREYVWEAHSSVTGRYYRNTDSIIKWHDGKLVHMQHAVDITDTKMAQFALNKRLAQQSLMASISQSFLSDADIEKLLPDALRMIGEFMDTAQILFYKIDRDGETLICENEWVNSRHSLQPRIGAKLLLKEPLLSIVKGMAEGDDFYLSSNDPRMKAAMSPYRVNFKSYLSMPLFINKKLYGAVDFSKDNDDAVWTESDISMVSLFASILTGALEIHLMEAQLIAAKDLAEQSSRSKSDFLSRMSHEIRTPLNAVIGMIGIAMNTDDMEKIRYCHERADSASKHLLGVINDILDMSKIEADKFELDNHEFYFERMLINISNVAGFRAEEKKQNFIVNLNKNVPDFVIGDDLRLSQVITNLLSNAVKFTPEGGTIMLNIDKIEDTGEDVTLRIEVEDTGIGISKEQQSRLFTAFEQAEGSTTRKFGGTGLGLAISKRIVELMGGGIWIESEPGQGSRFIFTIKARKGTENTRTVLSEKIERDKLRILAVDDAPEIREYFIHVMQSLGLPCDVADGGPEALAKVHDCGGEPYNIFFIDWQMPEMDGIELTKRIKQVNGDNSIIFMISVADWSAIEKEALAAGVKAFISKPLFPSTLLNAINECLEPGYKKAKPSVPDAYENYGLNLENHKILIAEDVEINREIMSAVLEKTGITIDFAEDGEIAVSQFREHPGKYSLIFMDIHMPRMDGYEATRQIRGLGFAHAETIPIIAMTANVFREDIEACLAAGMNDHLGKPVDPDMLFDKLGKYLT